MTSLKTSIKTITYLSDTGCLEIQGASLEKQKRLFKEYGVTGTPSVYVNGRYHIENGAFQADSVESFRKSYVAAVMSLLNRTVIASV